RFAGAAVQRGGAEEAPRSAAGVLRSVRRKGGGGAPQHAREDRSAGAGSRLDGAAGQTERPRGSGRRTGSGHRGREAARQNSVGDGRGARGLSAAQIVL